LNHDTYNDIVTQRSKPSFDKLEDYYFAEELGKGAYGVVRKALHKPINTIFVVKIYDKYKLMDQQKRDSVKREINLLRKTSNKHIVKLYDVINTPKQVFLFMELITGQSLLNYLKSKFDKRLDESEAKRLFYQLINGIEYLHAKNIYHRDIKLENIVFDGDNNLKIIDFGFATFAPKNKYLNFFCGTPSYMAPEICSKRDYLGQGADIWSCGVLLYSLLCGHFPFKGKSEKELFSKINEGEFGFPENVSRECRHFIRKILNVNPSQRPSAGEILSEYWMNS